MLNGGAPRTNPGSDIDDWEPGQQDDNNRTMESLPSQDNPYPVDRQVTRIAFGGNGAIFPRNKFNKADGTAGTRRNQLVRESKLSTHSNIILATEFAEAEDWQSLADDGQKIKSHRPFIPFVGLTGGSSTPDWYYGVPEGNANFPYFRYPYTGESAAGSESEIKLEAEIAGQTFTNSQCNLSAVGRIHPGGGAVAGYGGASNFVFVDGHVERKNIVETIRARQWGDRFYSLTGPNKVHMAQPGQ